MQVVKVTLPSAKELQVVILYLWKTSPAILYRIPEMAKAYIT
jgi:hypothetical protein